MKMNVGVAIMLMVMVMVVPSPFVEPSPVSYALLGTLLGSAWYLLVEFWNSLAVGR